jgi:hypothetical protein
MGYNDGSERNAFQPICDLVRVDFVSVFLIDPVRGG